MRLLTTYNTDLDGSGYLQYTVWNATLTLLEMCGAFLAEQAAKHAGALVLVFASCGSMLLALHQVLSRWHVALRPLQTNTCRGGRDIGRQGTRSRVPPLDDTIRHMDQINMLRKLSYYS